MKLRPYQEDSVRAFYNYYAHGNGGNGIMVLPTAAGKSVVIGSLISEICQKWPGQRIILLSHVRELILQNHSKIIKCWDKAPAGIYSAALGKREATKDIVTATVQSVYKKAKDLGHRDLCFIDECHLLQGQRMGMYGRLLADLMEINPAMKVCGFSATEYRLDRGLLTDGEGAIFNDVIIEISIQHLLDDGYLTPPISKSSLVQADLAGVKKLGGEFNIKQMAARFDQKEFINAALESDLPFLQDRRSIALFCATLENAAHVADGMLERGIDCEVIDGKMRQEDRDDKLERFRSGELRALASVGVITTGTDIPNMDAVVLFRATESPGLYQQIIGRGFRVMYAEGMPLDTAGQRRAAIAAGKKPNFLTLDHGGNIERHGAITNVEKPQKKEKGARAASVKMKIRICDICRSAWPLETSVCGVCGTQLKIERDPTSNLSIEASDAEIMGTPFSRGEKAEWFDVDDVEYNLHTTGAMRHSLRVTYFCGILRFNEWLHFSAPIGSKLYANAVKWWSVRTHTDTPTSVNEALINCDKYLKKPLRIQVVKKEFYEVLRYGFQPIQQESPNSAA